MSLDCFDANQPHGRRFVSLLVVVAVVVELFGFPVELDDDISADLSISWFLSLEFDGKLLVEI